MTPIPHQYSPAKEEAMTREEFVTSLAHSSERVGPHRRTSRWSESLRRLQDFDAVTRAKDDAELSLSEAAAKSGYSGDHLRRLHRLGKLPAYRKGRNLFFRSGHLPRKPTAPGLSPYDPVADARRVISQRHEER
jgi:hypothetical protein